METVQTRLVSVLDGRALPEEEDEEEKGDIEGVEGVRSDDYGQVRLFVVICLAFAVRCLSLSAFRCLPFAVCLCCLFAFALCCLRFVFVF